eukprot:67764_1
MQILIRTPEGKTFTLNVSPNDEIIDVKHQIEQRKGIPVDQQRLLFEGKQLNINTKTLKDYEIEDYYKLTLKIHVETQELEIEKTDTNIEMTDRHRLKDINTKNDDYRDQTDCMRKCFDRIGNDCIKILYIVIFLGCFAIGFSICVILIYVGSIKIDKGLTYSNEATEELCLIQSYKAVDCEYGCGEDDYCKGTAYAHTVIVKDKCDYLELYELNYDKCQGEFRTIGNEYKCYVLDCDKQQFSFFNHTKNIGTGVVLTVIGVLFTFCVCACFVKARTVTIIYKLIQNWNDV